MKTISECEWDHKAHAILDTAIILSKWGNLKMLSVLKIRISILSAMRFWEMHVPWDKSSIFNHFGIWRKWRFIETVLEIHTLLSKSFLPMHEWRNSETDTDMESKNIFTVLNFLSDYTVALRENNRLFLHYCIKSRLSSHVMILHWILNTKNYAEMEVLDKLLHGKRF